MSLDAEYHRTANPALADLTVEELNAKRSHLVSLMQDDRRTLQAIEAWLDLKDVQPEAPSIPWSCGDAGTY